MKTFLVLMFCFGVLQTAAQPDTSQRLQKSLLRYTKPFFRVYPVVYNNNIRLQRGEAASLFSSIPEAAKAYNQYRNRYKVGLYSYAGFFAFTALAAASFDKSNRGVTATGLALSVSSFLSAIVFFSSGEGKLRKAVKLYNNRMSPTY